MDTGRKGAKEGMAANSGEQTEKKIRVVIYLSIGNRVFE